MSKADVVAEVAPHEDANPERHPSQPRSQSLRKSRVSSLNYASRWLGCCDIASNGEGPPNLREGVLESRVCTDLPWLALMIVFTVVLVSVVWVPVFNESNPDVFRGASDYANNICGISEGYEDLRYGAWPNLAEYDVLVCVDECSKTSATGSSFTIDGTSVPGVNGYNSYSSIFWCVPDADEATEAFMESYDSGNLNRLVADMYKYYTCPLLAIPFTALFMCCFFFFVRFCLKLLLKALFYGLLLANIVCAVSLMRDGPSDDPQSYYTGVGIVCVGATLWCMLMVFWLQLMEVVDVLKKASEAMAVMPNLFMVPIITFPGTVGVLFMWYFVTALMFTASEKEQLAIASLENGGAALSNVLADLSYPETETTYYYVTQFDLDLQKTFFVHLFWMFWGITFVEYFNFLVVSGAVADWFMDQELVDDPENNVEYDADTCGNWGRMRKSLYRTIRYHLGTIAFASALIALLQTVETFLLYVQEHMGESQNPFAKVVVRIILAVVKCFECIMDRCNKNTLVVTATLGSPFCSGCGTNLKLFFRNMATMVMGHGMIYMLVFLANFAVAILSAGLAGYLTFGESTDATSMAFPILGAFVVSFVIAKVMLGVWDAAAVTILVCVMMLKEWYPNEYGLHLAKHAEHCKEAQKPVEASDVDLQP